MSFAIHHGLFKLNITDYHAILGVPIDADSKQIRLTYLKIAQQLHPDTCKGDVVKKQLANELLSKLVNPAYENLSRKNYYAEYQLVLVQISKRLGEQSDRITVASEPAQTLLKSATKVDLVYRQLVRTLATDQYKNLQQTIDKIALISELNLVYLMIKQGQGIMKEDKRTVTSVPTKSSQVETKAAQQQDNQIQDEESIVQSRINSYIRRAQEYINKNNFTQAITELRDAIKIDPNNSTCHGLLGKAYLYQNQLTMAKIHSNKAYQANAKDPIAIETKELLDKLTNSKTNTGSKSTSSDRTSKDKAEIKSAKTTLFGGLFGAKKK
jgi:curved DNA-binding protein CbpA